MHIKTTLAVVAAGAVMLVAAPQGVALPQTNVAKRLNSSNVERPATMTGVVMVGVAVIIAATMGTAAVTIAAVLASASTSDSNSDGTTSRQMPQHSLGHFLCADGGLAAAFIAVGVEGLAEGVGA